ncbi:hypothetical protein LCGC14_2917230, partial [marine sediment metagenome]
MGRFMERLLQAAPEELVVLLAVLAALTAAVIYVLGLIRAKAAQQE